MKKLFTAIIVVSLLMIVGVSIGLAAPGSVNFKGTVSDMNSTEGWLEVEFGGESVTVTAPEGFDFDSVALDDLVHVKGVVQEDDSVLADWIKLVLDEEEPVETEEPEEPEDPVDDDGDKEDSAYCSGEKDNPHPFAAGLAESYDVTVEEVMEYFCEGFGMGQIMLALQTQELMKEEGEVGEGNAWTDFLEMRRETGWGKIWQELKLIGKDKDAHSPPGQLKKLQTEGGEGFVPPGQQKKDNGEFVPPGQQKKNQEDGEGFVPPGQSKKTPKPDK